MRKIEIVTVCKRMLADVFTPVGIYLRLRDRFRDTVLLESTDHHSSENSYSFIGINAIGGIEIRTPGMAEFKLPGQKPERVSLENKKEVPQLLWDFMQQFDVKRAAEKEARFAQGLFGYTSYDAVQFFENIDLTPGPTPKGEGSKKPMVQTPTTHTPHKNKHTPHTTHP
jgi:anthranilate synthase component 1